MQNLVALGLLGGAVAKSAQLPLQTWLPDAMEGPTPVSALIHAATMVTAGVYLIVRTHPLFELAPHVQDLAAGLGALTIVMAGLIALVQTDIKRVIAYSTMSQIGYMFLGAGIGAYANAMFHLMTHAFFKALLFLAAGIVIHALAGEQDIRKMGGLRRLMPWTWAAMLIGGLALTGIPPLSGFFSKDSILAAALDRGWYGYLLFAAGLFGAFLTGLYTFRMLFIVFGGEPSPYVQEHPPHAHGDGVARWSMYLSVGVLTILAVIGGGFQFAGVWTTISDWLEPVAKPLVEASNTQEAVASDRRRCGRSRGDRGRLVDLLGAPVARAAAGRRARAEVLLRRALRRALLLADGRAREDALLGRRGAARQRLDPGRQRRGALGRLAHACAPDRPRPLVRARARGRRHRPHPRLRGGAMMSRRLDGGSKGAEVPALPVPERV